MSTSPGLDVVVLNWQDGTVSVRWEGESGSWPVDAERLSREEDAVRAAEASGDPLRRGTARERLGRALFEALDGPCGALTRRVAGANRTWQLAIRAITPRGPDASHPGARWRWHLLRDDGGPLFAAGGYGLTVQLSEVTETEPHALPEGCVRIAFMAYSPRGVEPELDSRARRSRSSASSGRFTNTVGCGCGSSRRGPSRRSAPR